MPNDRGLASGSEEAAKDHVAQDPEAMAKLAQERREHGDAPVGKSGNGREEDGG